jgi:hypothetical protein
MAAIYPERLRAAIGRDLRGRLGVTKIACGLRAGKAGEPAGA